MRIRVVSMVVSLVLASCGRGPAALPDVAGEAVPDIPEDDLVSGRPVEDDFALATPETPAPDPETEGRDPEPDDPLGDPGAPDLPEDSPDPTLEGAIIAEDLAPAADQALGGDDASMLEPDAEDLVEAAPDWEPPPDAALDIATDGTAEAGAPDPGPPPEPFECWADSFEWDADSGWEATGLWHRIHANQDLVDVWAGPPFNYVVLNGPATLTKPKDGKRAYWYGRDEDGSYLDVPAAEQVAGGGTSVEPHEGVLVSPWIDLTGATRATLFFWSWWEIESQHPAGYDLSTVEASQDGETWVEVARLNPPVVPPGASPVLPYTVNGVGMPPSWHRTIAWLDAFAGGLVRIRFRFRTGDVFFNAFRGWMVDEVFVMCVP